MVHRRAPMHWCAGEGMDKLEFRRKAVKHWYTGEGTNKLAFTGAVKRRRADERMDALEVTEAISLIPAKKKKKKKKTFMPLRRVSLTASVAILAQVRSHFGSSSFGPNCFGPSRLSARCGRRLYNRPHGVTG
uniref:Uncharacterized protein n=1 Tax=Prorocentrum micans TaxID=2945 RepID=A0A7S2TB37_PROMC|mmetsp:Transcript_14263/g.11477  ORF Transcript_14263/g.11477 Transcript_14263/m.11477 type:complete len:132 (+) Transcript_14263:18-413(+)